MILDQFHKSLRFLLPNIDFKKARLVLGRIKIHPLLGYNLKFGNWLIRFGCILLYIGYFIPPFHPNIDKSRWLSFALSYENNWKSFHYIAWNGISLIGVPDIQPQLLFLVLPVCAFLLLFSTFIPTESKRQDKEMFFGQVIIFGLFVCSILLSFIQLITKNKTDTLLPFLNTGIAIIMMGSALILLGLLCIFEFLQIHQDSVFMNKQSIIAESKFNFSRYNYLKGKDTYYENTPYLQILRGTGYPSTTIFINSKKFCIGRAKDNDLQLLDVSVSRNHVCIRYGYGKWFIQDLQSTCGTILNGQLINASQIQAGDIISIGHQMILFKYQSGLRN
jgi:hypothetical protein